MNRNELNTNWIQAILYYCHQINSSQYFDTWGSECGTWSTDGNGDTIIDVWLLGDAPYNIEEPTITTLLTYTVNDVNDFHTNYYINVTNVFDANFGAYFFASSSSLNSMPPARLAIMDGYRAFDTTLKRVVFWNNTASEWQLA